MDATSPFTTAEEITERIAALETIDWETYHFDQVGEHDASDLFTDRDSYPGPDRRGVTRTHGSSSARGRHPGPGCSTFNVTSGVAVAALFVTLTESIVTPSVTLNVTLPGPGVVASRPSLMPGPRRRPPRSPPLAECLRPGCLPRGCPFLYLPLPRRHPRPSPASDRDARRLLLIEPAGHPHVSSPWVPA